jgi:dUTP pyrophosphatase
MVKDFKELKTVLGNLNKLKELTTNNDLVPQINTDISGIGDIDLSEFMDIKKEKIPLKYINKSNNEDPKYFHDGDSGFDFRAYINEKITIEPGQRKLIKTGLYFEIPNGYELQVRPRSGLAIKDGITILNSPGTVDSNYRGEIKIILINLGYVDFIVENGDRIGQGVVSSVISNVWGELTPVKNLKHSSRNDKGFGSTGKK